MKQVRHNYICDQCDKEIDGDRVSDRHDTRHWCSVECAAAFLKKDAATVQREIENSKRIDEEVFGLVRT